MIEILIIVCIILLIWKWSMIKPYLASVPILGDAEKNSNLAHDNALKNVNDLYKLQSSINKQLQDIANSTDQSNISQQLTIQTTKDVALVSQKISDSIALSISSKNIVSDFQTAIDTINTVQQAVAQVSIQSTNDQTAMNANVASAQSLINYTSKIFTDTKAIMANLNTQVNSASSSITSAMDIATSQANNILSIGNEIEVQLVKFQQLLQSTYTQSKLLLTQLISGMQILSQVYSSLAVVDQQITVIGYLLYKNPYIPPLINTLPSITKFKINDIITQFNTISPTLINILASMKECFINDNLPVYINGVKSDDINYLLETVILNFKYLVQSASPSTEQYHTTYDEISKLIITVSGYVNPIQTAILSANTLQTNALTTIKKINQTADLLMSSVNSQNANSQVLNKGISDTETIIKNAIVIQQKIVNDASNINSLQQELLNAIKARQYAPNSNLQQASQVTIQNVIKKIQPSFQNIANDLQESLSSQQKTSSMLTHMSNLINSTNDISNASKNYLASLIDLIAKSKLDTQSAVSQAKAVQDFINSFLELLKPKNFTADDIVQEIKHLQININEVIVHIQKIVNGADKSLTATQSLSTISTNLLDTLLNLINNEIFPITGIRVSYEIEPTSKSVIASIYSVKDVQQKTGPPVSISALINKAVYPKINRGPNNLVNFDSTSFTSKYFPYFKQETVQTNNQATVQAPAIQATNTSSSNSGTVTGSGSCDTTGKCTNTTCINGVCTTKITYANTTSTSCVNGVCNTTTCTNGVCTTKPANQTFINRRQMVFDAVKNKDYTYNMYSPLNDSVDHYLF